MELQTLNCCLSCKESVQWCALLKSQSIISLKLVSDATMTVLTMQARQMPEADAEADAVLS